MKELELKYYDVSIIGDLERDEQNVPKKDEKGNYIPKWIRTSNPPAGLQAIGLGSGSFIQTELVEVNLGDDVKISKAAAMGYEIGPLNTRGQTVVVFESRQREIFKALSKKILDHTIDIVIGAREVPANDGTTNKVWRIVGKIKQFAIPGNLHEFSVGFDYYLFRRDSKSKVIKAIEANTYNKEGKIVSMKVIRNTARVFLFADELTAAEAHIADAIKACAEHKVPQAAGVNERKDDIVADAAAAAEAVNM